MNSLQKVIKLTKENLDKIEGQFLNVLHPPSIFLEVGDNFTDYSKQNMIGNFSNGSGLEMSEKNVKLLKHYATFYIFAVNIFLNYFLQRLILSRMMRCKSKSRRLHVRIASYKFSLVIKIIWIFGQVWTFMP